MDNKVSLALYFFSLIEILAILLIYIYATDAFARDLKDPVPVFDL
jgi:hypothetical protein